jgi:formiminotetrahydrofolate cyclodeaminase
LSARAVTGDGETAWSAIGPTTALVVALSAGVVGEAAHQSVDVWGEATGAVAQAEAIRRRAIRLAHEDREAHLIASEALDAAKQSQERTPGGQPLATALAQAAELPLEIAETAADAAALAALVAEDGSSDSRADSAGAAVLAASAVSAAAHLIEVNLATAKDDERLVRAGELRVAADAAAERARAASA